MNLDIIAKKYTDVDIYEKELDNKDCKLTILRGGFTSPTPQLYMDRVVSAYMEGKLHNQFIEIHLDIPQIRVVIENLNDLNFQSIDDYVKSHSNV